MWLDRILECYRSGAAGVYIYQCDSMAYDPVMRRQLLLIGSLDALERWRETENRRQADYSNGIYLAPPGGRCHRWQRVRVWIEGFRPDTVELYLDGDLVNRFEGPPYMLLSEGCEDDERMTPGVHTVGVRASLGQLSIARDFQLEFA